MHRKSFVIALWITLASIGGTGQATNQIDDARDLYYAADYEEALAVLNGWRVQARQTSG